MDNLHVVLGSGPLGLSVVDTLLRRGDEVRVVNRSGRASEDLPVEWRAADVTDPAQMRTATAGATVVYHCAQPAYTNWPAGFPPITRGIVEGLSGGSARLVVGDNLYMYGAVDGPIHERLSYRATGKKGRARAAMADALLAAHAEGKVPVVIGRASDFFGPRVRESLAGEIVFGAAIQGKAAQLVGNIDLPHSLSFIADFGRALVDLGSRESAFGRAWHIPNASVPTMRQFVSQVYRAAGTPLKIQAGPKFVLQALGLFNPQLREILEMWYAYDQPYVVDSSDFETEFGWQATPFAESIPATIAWYRSHQRVPAHV